MGVLFSAVGAGVGVVVRPRLILLDVFIACGAHLTFTARDVFPGMHKPDEDTPSPFTAPDPLSAPVDSEIRMVQIEHVRRNCESLHPGSPVFMFGDLNMRTK